jgi:hypothetical protein
MCDERSRSANRKSTRNDSREWIHRDIAITLIEATCALVLATQPRTCAIGWVLALNVFLIVFCEIAPRFHHHPLFHFAAGVVTGYSTLLTSFLCSHHLFRLLL